MKLLVQWGKQFARADLIEINLNGLSCQMISEVVLVLKGLLELLCFNGLLLEAEL